LAWTPLASQIGTHQPAALALNEPTQAMRRTTRGAQILIAPAWLVLSAIFMASVARIKRFSRHPSASAPIRWRDTSAPFPVGSTRNSAGTRTYRLPRPRRPLRTIARRSDCRKVLQNCQFSTVRMQRDFPRGVALRMRGSSPLSCGCSTKRSSRSWPCRFPSDNRCSNGSMRLLDCKSCRLGRGGRHGRALG